MKINYKMIKPESDDCSFFGFFCKSCYCFGILAQFLSCAVTQLLTYSVTYYKAMYFNDLNYTST